jgi:hypothetical protein
MPPPYPPFPCLDCCFRQPEASLSCRILPSAAAVFPLSGERPPSFAVPKLELILSSPFHTSAVGPHTHRRRCPEPLFCLPAAPSFGYAPPLPAMPGVTPKSHWCSRRAPHRRLATIRPSANMPPHRPTRLTSMF